MLPFTWWHQMETLLLLLAICAWNSPVTGEFPTQMPMTWSHDVFFDLRLNKQLSKQSWGCWFEMPSHPLWRHCNEGWDMVFLLWVQSLVYNFPSLMLYWTQSYSSGLSHDDIMVWFHITGPLWGESPSQRWIHSKRVIQNFDDFFAVSLKKLLLRKQWFQLSWALQWHHNECDGISNHQPHDCLLNCLFRHWSKKASKLCTTGLCEGNSPVTSDTENVSILWSQHGLMWHHCNVFWRFDCTWLPWAIVIVIEKNKTTDWTGYHGYLKCLWLHQNISLMIFHTKFHPLEIEFYSAVI